jgi:DNA-binding NarL/FixJ family response regulator
MTMRKRGKLFGQRHPAPSRPSLAYQPKPAQLSALDLAAQGFEATDIAKILSLSEAAVAAMLRPRSAP